MNNKTEQVQALAAAISDDIMANMADECDIIRDALQFFFENSNLEELQDLYKTRALNV